MNDDMLVTPEETPATEPSQAAPAAPAQEAAPEAPVSENAAPEAPAEGEAPAAQPQQPAPQPQQPPAAPPYPQAPYPNLYYGAYPGQPAPYPYPNAVPGYPPVYPQAPYPMPPYGQPAAPYAPHAAAAAPAANPYVPQPAPEQHSDAEEGEPRQFAFKVRNLSKDYDGHMVLNDISFDIPAGKIVGLLGPNGCGKSTLMKILAGLIHDYTGVIKVGGRSIGIESKAHLAYLPDTTYFPERFRTIDCINYFDDFFEDFNKSKAVNFAAQFGLDLNQRIKTMSKGMQEKLQLLMVMSRKADIYLLDEPLGGVDPAARGVIMDIIMNNYKENATVVLSTHLVNDLEHSFDHVLMLGKGKVLVNTGIDVLRATGKTVEDIFKEVIGDAWEVD